MPQNPLVERELALPFDEEEEELDDEDDDDDEQDAALDTAEEEDVLWTRGGGVGLFFLLMDKPLADKHESVEWSREWTEDLPLVINCCEKVTFEGTLFDDCERNFDSWTEPLVGEMRAWRTM